jgi:hypothetical protein
VYDERWKARANFSLYSVSLPILHCMLNACVLMQGSENDIRMKFYNIAFQQHYDEDTGTVSWKVVDYSFAGDIPYL